MAGQGGNGQAGGRVYLQAVLYSEVVRYLRLSRQGRRSGGGSSRCRTMNQNRRTQKYGRVAITEARRSTGRGVAYKNTKQASGSRPERNRRNQAARSRKPQAQQCA